MLMNFREISFNCYANDVNIDLKIEYRSLICFNQLQPVVVHGYTELLPFDGQVTQWNIVYKWKQ